LVNNVLTYVFAVVGVVVPVIAFLWEFVFSGRKRLGYRVQVNDPVRASSDSTEETSQLGVLRQLTPEDDDGTSVPLDDMSLVLLKIENNGWTEIERDDYRYGKDDSSGITFRFPGRTIEGVALTAPSREMKAVLRRHTTGVETRQEGSDGLITLPRFALGQRDSYKVMAVLQRSAGAPGHGDDELAPPELDGGGIKSGRVIRTESRTRISTAYLLLVVLLVAVVVVQFVTGLVDKPPRPGPMDCSAGPLALSGSTAVEKVMQASAASYERRCPGANIDTSGFKGSDVDLKQLASEKDPDPAGQLTFTDGLNSDFKQLVSRPVAFVLFAPVVNSQVTGIDSLTRKQIADLFAGNYANWDQLVPGLDLPVTLIGRHEDSGSRQAFEREILQGSTEPQANSNDCSPGKAEPLRCEANTTTDLLNLVASTPGAIGYSEVSTATADSRVRVIQLDGHQATREETLAGNYHFGATEYAYSPGDPPPDSLAAGFLRYLDFGEGKDTLSKDGDVPCAELADPVKCLPYQ
jgi:phosphate transport system substrate-binding protein